MSGLERQEEDYMKWRSWGGLKGSEELNRDFGINESLEIVAIIIINANASTSAIPTTFAAAAAATAPAFIFC